MYSEYFMLFRVVCKILTGSIMIHRSDAKIMNLPSSIELIVGIDQSTNQTGIAVATRDGTLISVMDVINDGLPRHIYITLLKQFMKKQFADTKVAFTIMEDTENHSDTIRTRVILSGVKGVLEDFLYDEVPFSQGRIDAIPAGTWRKHYLISSEYDGLRKGKDVVKQSVVTETMKRFTWIGDYYLMQGKGSDSADAVGVLYGYREEVFADPQMRSERISVLRPHIDRIQYYSNTVALKAGMTLEGLAKGTCGNLPYYKGLEKYIYNGTMSFADNCKRAVTPTNAVCLLICTDRKTADVLKWELKDKSAYNGEPLVVVTYRYNDSAKIINKTLVGQEEFWLA